MKRNAFYLALMSTLILATSLLLHACGSTSTGSTTTTFVGQAG